MKVMRFKRAVRTNKIVIGVHPCVIWGIGATIFAGNENARCGGTSIRGQYGDTELARGLEIMPFFNANLRLRPTQNFLGPQRSISAAIGNEGNTFSIRRPTWR